MTGFFKAIAGVVKNAPKRVTAGAGLTLAVGLIAGFEGLSTKTYEDIGGVLTYCYGETEGAIINARYTDDQCKTLLERRVSEFNAAIKKSVKVPMSVKREAALTSFAYNIGISAFERSTLLKKLNAGDTVGACNELDKWTYVGGMYVRGLANRRAQEKALCLDGVNHAT